MWTDPLLVVALSVTVAAATVLLYRWGAGSGSCGSEFFNPVAAKWWLVISGAAMALTADGCLVSIPHWGELYSRLGNGYLAALDVAVSVAVLVSGGVVGVWLGIRVKPLPLPRLREKVAISFVAAAACNSIPASGILMAGQILHRRKRLESSVYNFLDLQRDLFFFVGVLVLALVMSVLVSVAWREALGAVVHVPLSWAAVITYGASMSCLIALVFLPSYFSMTAAGELLLQRSLPDPSSPLDAGWFTLRKELQEVLGIRAQFSGLGVLLGGVLSPLLAAIGSNWISARMTSKGGPTGPQTIPDQARRTEV